MELSGTVLLLLIPLVLVELGLMAFALMDLFKRKRVAGGNKLVWGILIVLLGMIGPVVYLVAGRREE